MNKTKIISMSSFYYSEKIRAFLMTNDSMSSASIQLPQNIYYFKEIRAWLKKDVSEFLTFLKVKLNHTKTLKESDDHCLKTETDDSRLEDCITTIMTEVELGLPKMIIDMIPELGSDLNELLLYATVFWRDWRGSALHCKSNRISYSDSFEDKRTFMKDSFKYLYHNEFEWRRAGYGEFMTGDFMGAVLSASRPKSRMNIKFLNGSKGTIESTAPSIRNRTESDIKWIDCNNFDSLFRSNKDLGAVVQSYPNKKIPYQSVAETFGARYSKGKAYKLRDTPKKPWNVHIAHTTKAVKKETFKRGADGISRKFKANLAELLRAEDKESIRAYIITLKIQDNAIILWGRLSGQKGAAHSESDSDPIVWDGLIAHLKEQYPTRQIVLIGDKIEVNETSKKNVVQIHEYWNNRSLKTTYKNGKLCQEYFPSIYKNGKLCQDYFSSILIEKKCTVIGMRSGNHHSTVFLGGKVIYFDDLQSNFTGAGREEDLAGRSSRGRAEFIKQGNSKANSIERELKSPGVFPLYRRLAVQAQLGYYSKYNETMEKVLKELNKVSNILNRGQVVTLTRGCTFSEYLSDLESNLSLLSDSFKVKASIQSEKNTHIHEALLSFSKFFSQLEISSMDEQKPLGELNFEALPEVKPVQLSEDTWTAFLEALNLVKKSYSKADSFKKTMVCFSYVPLKQRMGPVLNATWVKDKDKAIAAFTKKLLHINDDLKQSNRVLQEELNARITQVISIEETLNSWPQKLGLQSHEWTELDILIETLDTLEIQFRPVSLILG
jgi:hypothetical protein